MQLELGAGDVIDLEASAAERRVQGELSVPPLKLSTPLEGFVQEGFNAESEVAADAGNVLVDVAGLGATIDYAGATDVMTLRGLQAQRGCSPSSFWTPGRDRFGCTRKTRRLQRFSTCPRQNRSSREGLR